MDYKSDSEEIIEDARSSISEYCMNECKALCCKKGFISLHSEEQINLVLGDKRKEFEKNGRLKEVKDGVWSLALPPACPQLEDNKCRIHKNPLRPQLCGDCPIFVFGKFIVPAPYCPAVNNGLLDSHFAELKNRGFKLI